MRMGPSSGGPILFLEGLTLNSDALCYLSDKIVPFYDIDKLSQED